MDISENYNIDLVKFHQSEDMFGIIVVSYGEGVTIVHKAKTPRDLLKHFVIKDGSTHIKINNILIIVKYLYILVHRKSLDRIGAEECLEQVKEYRENLKNAYMCTISDDSVEDRVAAQMLITMIEGR